VSTFYSHIWKRFSRSSRFKTGIAGRIFIGFAFLLLLVQAGAYSYFISDILKKEAPGSSPVELFNHGLFYALLILLVMRVFLQRQSFLSFQPYLHLPIKRNNLIRFILFDLALTFFNLITLVLILPFFFRAVIPHAGGTSALSWLLTFTVLMIFTNYLAAYFRFQLTNNFKVVAIIILLGLVLGLLEYFHIISLAGLSKFFFAVSLHSLWPVLSALFFTAAIIAVTILYLKSHLYINIGPQKAGGKGKKQRTQPKNPQLYKELLKLEFRLLLRSKRTRTHFYYLFFAPIYFILVLSNLSADPMDPLVAFQILVIGNFVLQIGAGLLSYEGALFDKLLTINLSIKQYYLYKWLLYSVSCVAFFIITLPLGFIFPDKIQFSILTASLIFNMGITIAFTLMLSLFDPKYFDLDGGVSFNFQGASFKSFLWVLPLVTLFLLFRFVFKVPPNIVYVFILGGLGIVFLLFMPIIIKYINDLFLKRKYFIAERLREGRY
jgi:hypothetical protein